MRMPGEHCLRDIGAAGSPAAAGHSDTVHLQQLAAITVITVIIVLFGAVGLR